MQLHAMQLKILVLAFIATVIFVDATRVRDKESSVGKARLSKAVQSEGHTSAGVKGLLWKSVWLMTLLGASSPVDAGIFGRGSAPAHGLSRVDMRAQPELSLDVKIDNPTWGSLPGGQPGPVSPVMSYVHELQEWTANGELGSPPKVPSVLKHIERDARGAVNTGLKTFVEKVAGGQLSGDKADIQSLARNAYTSVSAEIDNIMKKAATTTEDVRNGHPSEPSGLMPEKKTYGVDSGNIAKSLAKWVLKPEGPIMQGAGDAKHLAPLVEAPLAASLNAVIQDKAKELLNKLPEGRRNDVVRFLAQTSIQEKVDAVNRNLGDFVEQNGGEWQADWVVGDPDFSKGFPDFSQIRASGSVSW